MVKKSWKYERLKISYLGTFNHLPYKRLKSNYVLLVINLTLEQEGRMVSFKTSWESIGTFANAFYWYSQENQWSFPEERFRGYIMYSVHTWIKPTVERCIQNCTKLVWLYLRGNSRTYTYVEVSGHNLESSQTWGFYLRFLLFYKMLFSKLEFSSLIDCFVWISEAIRSFCFVYTYK